MKERVGYITKRGGEALYAVYHEPERPRAAYAGPVLIAPPLLEERKNAYVSLVALARTLSANGHPVLRFDYRGSGESSGSAEAWRWSDLASDLRAAHERLLALTGVGHATWIGLRMGATLVLSEATSPPAPRAVVALAPFAKGAACTRYWQIRSKIRSQLTASAIVSADGTASQASVEPDPLRPRDPDASVPQGEEVLDLDGYEVGASFIADCKRLDLLSRPEALSCPSLLLQLSQREEPLPESTHLKTALGDLCQLHCLRIQPFWDRLDGVDTSDLNRQIVAFLRQLES